MKYTALDATVSNCGKYRYDLQRWWGEPLLTVEKACVFVMLNPSTADGTKDDPTIGRCVGFADAWGYKRLVVLNLFAFRATEPREMFKSDDPVGPLSEFYYGLHLANAGLTVAAWGAHGEFRKRAKVVRETFTRYGFPLHHLGLTQMGHPKHPLYLKADTKPEPWE